MSFRRPCPDCDDVIQFERQPGTGDCPTCELRVFVTAGGRLEPVRHRPPGVPFVRAPGEVKPSIFPDPHRRR